jgi:hypothetical protein
MELHGWEMLDEHSIVVRVDGFYLVRLLIQKKTSYTSLNQVLS